jgi:glycosyltransferase involved in cell wall biosynthesis
MPLVLVDLLFFTGKKGGMETYVRELYRELGSIDSEFAFIGLASTEFLALDTSWFPGEIIDSGISGEDRVAWARGELVAVSRAAERIGADLIHAPANMGPWRTRVPMVSTIHDLLTFRHPRLLGVANSAIVRMLVRLAARASTRVITDSAASGDDVVRFLSVDRGRLDVIPLATVAPAVTGASKATAGDRPLILSTGNRLPHKNFESLVRAMALIEPALRPELVITGSHGDDPLAPLVAELGLTDDVRLEGWVSTEDLEALYARADAYVIPSLFEGFGLPVLDAMTRGCAVISSDIPVLREVGGDAALYVDARQPSKIAAAITRVIGDPVERDRLVVAGAARAAEFSWSAVAARTLASFTAALAR